MNERLEKLLSQSLPLDAISYKKRIELLQESSLLQENLPEEIACLDPRTQDKVLYSLKRQNRPHDPEPALSSSQDIDCPICLGKTTEVWDKAPLTKGYTFTNSNLYPIVYPFLAPAWSEMTESQPKAYGTHLLQWHSTEHDKDFHNMPFSDVVVCMERLAALEKYLLTQPGPAREEKEGYYGYIWVAKNYGRTSGSSLNHGHLQIIHSNAMPSSLERDKAFFQKEKKGFSDLLQEKANQNLVIQAYRKQSVLLLTPFCLKRMLECTICFRDTTKNYLHSLNRDEIQGLSQALKDAISALDVLMNKLHKELSYNLLFHIGEIGGLYIEILPYTQQMGGFEHLGAYTCLLTAQESTNQYHKINF